MSKPAWQSRAWGVLPQAWPLPQNWVAEWMELDDEIWFSRISPVGDPDIPPIVMLHGLVVSGTYFGPVAAYLDDHYRVYVPDLPGYGRSSSTRTWSIPWITSRVADWMDAHELGACVIVGNSLGCQIATQLAVFRPDLVAGLVLVAPTMDPRVTGIVHIALRAALDLPREHQSLWGIWLTDLFRAGPRRALRMLHESLTDDQVSRLPNVLPPTLIIGGERDPIVPPEWIYDMAKRMPMARPFIIPGSAHAMNYSSMNYSSPRDLARAIDVVIQGWDKHQTP